MIKNKGKREILSHGTPADQEKFIHLSGTSGVDQNSEGKEESPKSQTGYFRLKTQNRKPVRSEYLPLL